LKSGGNAPTILNAANEVAVERFLAGGIGFLDIAETVEATLSRMPNAALTCIDDVHAFDAEARRIAGEIVASRS
jgi:1-deoxy-D-xylulose-5-phosphate reductoisomerase